MFVWNSRNEIQGEILKFFAMSLIFYGLNAFCLSILVDHLKLNLLGSQLAVTCFLVVVNFYMQKNYVFLNRSHKKTLN